jgi:hypothetical protein
MLDVGGRKIAGGTIPAEIWHDYNELYHEGLPAKSFADVKPEDITWPNKTFEAGSWRHDPNLEIFEPTYKPLDAS